ncbi:hypothetical protein E2C01_075222 [Portunus trituberculatus]|uniref:Uncharacterized protein n=1 Tax=Portunus trituberculatus TaxID=210409 RepID=A0A5B7IGI5_PORTR|nr:hypothetical protein [Portunus trituberculatus]
MQSGGDHPSPDDLRRRRAAVRPRAARRRGNIGAEIREMAPRCLRPWEARRAASCTGPTTATKMHNFCKVCGGARTSGCPLPVAGSALTGAAGTDWLDVSLSFRLTLTRILIDNDHDIAPAWLLPPGLAMF